MKNWRQQIQAWHGAGGVSHFRLVRDNVLISWMHTRLVFGAIARLVFRR